jgi:hypothetical protein
VPEGKTKGFPPIDRDLRPFKTLSYKEENSLLSCQQCNSKKSDRINGVDPATGQLERLFNPRQDNWNEHFYLDPNTGVITGLTPIGRVTIKELGINEPEQIATRLRLLNAHLF